LEGARAVKPICQSNQVGHIATISNAEEISRKDFSPYTFFCLNVLEPVVIAFAAMKTGSDDASGDFLQIHRGAGPHPDRLRHGVKLMVEKRA
jgi:hypothetical protein